MNLLEADLKDVKLPREFVISRLEPLKVIRPEWDLGIDSRNALSGPLPELYRLNLKQCFLRKLSYAFGWGESRYFSLFFDHILHFIHFSQEKILLLNYIE